MEKRGIRTRKADLNRWIRTTNRLIAAVKKGIRSLLNWIAALKKEIEEAENQEPYLIELIGNYYQERNRGAWSQKAKNQNTKRFFAAYNFLQENDLHTVEQLEERVKNLSKETNDLLARVNANSARVKKLQDMGYRKVELIDTTDGKYMTRFEAGWMALSGSALLTGIK